jgi:hypothetical protein
LSLIESDFKEHEHKMPEASEAWPKISEETVYIDKKNKTKDKEKVIEKVYCSQTN